MAEFAAYIHDTSAFDDAEDTQPPAMLPAVGDCA